MKLLREKEYESAAIHPVLRRLRRRGRHTPSIELTHNWDTTVHLGDAFGHVALGVARTSTAPAIAPREGARSPASPAR